MLAMSLVTILETSVNKSKPKTSLHWQSIADFTADASAAVNEKVTLGANLIRDIGYKSEKPRPMMSKFSGINGAVKPSDYDGSQWVFQRVQRCGG